MSYAQKRLIHNKPLHGTFDHPSNDIVLKDLPEFPLFVKTIHDLLGIDSASDDIPNQIASFVHFAGKDFLPTLFNTVGEDNVLACVNRNTGQTESLSKAVNSDDYSMHVNPDFSAGIMLELPTHFVSMVMMTIIVHPTGSCSNLLKLLSGSRTNIDILSYFKNLSLHFLFGSGFWPQPSATLVSESCASISIQVHCKVPFVLQVISQLDIFFFLPKLFQIVHDHDKQILTRLVHLRPKGCPLGTFICRHAKNCANDMREFFTVQVLFSAADFKDNSVLSDEVNSGFVKIFNGSSVTNNIVLPCQDKCLLTPELLLPIPQCEEVRRVTTYLRMSSLLSSYTKKSRLSSEVEFRNRFGNRVSVLQTFTGSHARMVLSLVTTLYLAKPKYIQLIVSDDIETYAENIEKYNHEDHITVIRSIADIYLFSGFFRVFLIPLRILTSEFFDFVRRLKELVVETVVIDFSDVVLQTHLLDIVKPEQLVVAQPKKQYRQIKKASVKIEVFEVKPSSHNVRDIVNVFSCDHVVSVDLLHSVLVKIDVMGDKHVSSELQSELKKILQEEDCKYADLSNTRCLYYPPAKRRKENTPDKWYANHSDKFAAFSRKILPSFLSQKQLNFNILVVVNELSVVAYQKECQRQGLQTVLFGFDEGNTTQDKNELIRLVNTGLHVVFIPSMDCWPTIFKMQNIVVVDSCASTDNFKDKLLDVCVQRCIVLTEHKSYTQWRLLDNNGCIVDGNSVSSCLQYLGGNSINFSLK